MNIAEVTAFASSVPVAADRRVRFGAGEAVKRDTVLVRVETDDGLVGWGEAHHGRSAGTVAHLVDSALRDLVLGMDADDVVGVWARVERMQLSTHGLGAAAYMGLSGIDMALWDIRARAVGWPLYRLLGGAERAIPAYGGGISLGWQDPAALVDEVTGLRELGLGAVKLRLGDSVEADRARLTAVRAAYEDLEILTDANTAYSLTDVQCIGPVLADCAVGWLEEPFPPAQRRSYSSLRGVTTVPIAAGENHFGRYEFAQLLDDGVVSILQPDVSKTGGVTELLRIAALASAYGVRIHPHTSTTGLNMAASLHVLAAVDNAGYFEIDAARDNRLRDELTSAAYTLADDGTVRPPGGAGLGIEVDEQFLRAHPASRGASYV